MQDGNVCLADWCEVLHCDHFAGKPGTRHFFHHHTAPCRPKAKTKLKQQCQARHLHMSLCCSNFLVKRHSWLSAVTCAHAQDLAERCFPPGVGKEATLMYGKQGSTVAIIMHVLQGITRWMHSSAISLKLSCCTASTDRCMYRWLQCQLHVLTILTRLRELV